jgi:hypothetical protein
LDFPPLVQTLLEWLIFFRNGDLSAIFHWCEGLDGAEGFALLLLLAGILPKA